MCICHGKLPLPPPDAALPVTGVSTSTFAFFCATFLLYGGLEATLGGWLSTYTLRYAGLSLSAAAFCTTALWLSFAGGRALAGLVLRRVPERALRIGGILLTGAGAVLLREAGSERAVVTCASLIGLGIAPFFPVRFSLLIERGPTSRQAGACTAHIGLGSAVFPLMTGFVSNRLGSLQLALIVPIVIAVLLVMLCTMDRHKAIAPPR